MPKCVLCGKLYEFPKGTTLVMKDGTINYFCSSKCRKNKLMKRRKIRWINKSKKVKESPKEVKKEISKKE